MAAESRIYLGYGNFDATYHNGESKNFSGNTYSVAFYHRFNLGISLSLQYAGQSGEYEMADQKANYNRNAWVPAIGIAVKIFDTLLNPRLVFDNQGNNYGWELPIYFDLDNGWFWGFQYGEYNRETPVSLGGKVQLNNMTLLFIGMYFRFFSNQLPTNGEQPQQNQLLDSDVLINVFPTIYNGSQVNENKN